MASSPQLRGQSIVSRMRSESGQKSCTGGLAVLFFFFLLFLCDFFFNLFFRSFVAILILYQSKKKFGVSLYTPLLALLNWPRFSSTCWQVYPSKCTLKLRTCIGTLLNLSVIISNNQVFLLMLLQSQNTQFFTQSLCTCSWKYVFHLLHIIFKFSFCAQQVPRSLVDRVLYREYGPYQDRYPVPVDQPFCFFSSFSITFLRNFAAIPILYQPKKQFGASLYTPHNALLHQSRFSSTYWQVYPFKMHS